MTTEMVPISVVLENLAVLQSGRRSNLWPDFINDKLVSREDKRRQALKREKLGLPEITPGS